MNNQINDGGPAFPLQAHGDEAKSRYYLTQQGMTLRDYFAAAALQWLLADGGGSSSSWDDDAKNAYQAADAMIRAREVKP